MRAGDVRHLRLQDIDWAYGRLRVVGKGRSETRLPLPQDAGDAVLHYLEHYRPNVDDHHVFLRVDAVGPLRSSAAISCLVRLNELTISSRGYVDFDIDEVSLDTIDSSTPSQADSFTHVTAAVTHVAVLEKTSITPP